jgi:hypothetical protein
MEMKPLRTIIVAKRNSKDVHTSSALQGSLYSSVLHRNGTPPDVYSLPCWQWDTLPAFANLLSESVNHSPNNSLIHVNNVTDYASKCASN